MRHIDTALCWLLAAVLAFAGIDKLLHYEGFLNALANYVLVPRGWAPYLALPVILLELGLAAGLLWRPIRGPAAVGTGLILLVFTAALGINHLYGDRGVCGCWFSFTLAEGTAQHILSNLLLVAMAASVAWTELGPRSSQGSDRGEPDAEGAVSGEGAVEDPAATARS
ncbi:MAG: hypothetical protein MI919_36085 [Holophagales bacterium]|nr:hypothetical protein [Holophagales bacterium]